MGYIYYQAPFGKLGLTDQDDKITSLQFYPQEGQAVVQTTLLREATRQLDLYFAGKLREFDLPLAPKGTSFQQSVWKALCMIGYGETASYGEIARRIGNAKACRAVGMANNRNPIAIFIPCHRIVGSDGSLTGYGGGLDTKRFLLQLETGEANETI
ncbi:methylated-DNA--[protein]-cysteine S-methyltransferase [Oscillospiraceae bacterium PP1C4]